MQLINVDVPLDFNIFLLGDQHIGARLYDSDGWDTTVEMVLSPYDNCKNNFVVHHGDAIEGILVDDPRYGLEETTESRTLNQMHLWLKSIDPIKKQMICLLTGNHEFKLQKFGDVSAKMAQDSGVEYGTFSSVINYRHDGRTLFKHFATHGRKGLGSVADDEIRRRANMQLQLKRSLSKKHGQCLLMSRGHAHKVLVAPPTKELFLSDDGSKLHQNYTRPPDFFDGYINHNLRWYANAGSYLKTYGVGFSGYGERGDYDPVELGFCVAVVRGGKLVNVREEKI